MRALPGRESRTKAAAQTQVVTREGVAEAQRKRILLATAELVAKRGYRAVTVELIVKRAHVSFKTFYKHFSGKEECFLEFFDRTVARSRAEIGRVLEAEAESPWPQRVAAVIHGIFEQLTANPLLARAVVVEAPTVGPVIVERYEKTIKSLSPLLREGRRYSSHSGELPETLEDTLAGGVVWSAYQRLIVGDAERIEALLPEAVEFVLRPYVGEREAAQWAARSREQLDVSGTATVS